MSQVHRGTPLRYSGPFGANALCAVSMAIWAAGFPAAEALLTTWPPMALIVARFGLASLMLVTIWALLEGPAKVIGAPWLRALKVGGPGFGAGAYLLVLGQYWTDAVTASVLATTMPIIAIGLEVALDGRRLRLPLVGGLILVVLGGFIVTGAGPPGALTLKGLLAIVASVLLFSWGSRATVEEFSGSTALGQTTLTLVGGFLAIGTIFAIGWITGHALLPTAPIDAVQIRNLAIYAFGGMALSQLLWIMGVARLGVGFAAMHFNLAPFYVMLLLTLGGATGYGPRAAGAALVAVGVVLAQSGRRT